MSEEKNSDAAKLTNKKVYEPPQIKIVKLDTEVMLKTNCKIAGGGGRAGRECNTGGGGGDGCANSQAGS